MKYPTDIFYHLGRARGAEFDGGELNVLIPHLFNAIIIPVGPMRDVAGFGNTNIQRETFATEFQSAAPASTAAATSLICTFGRGLWRVYIGMHHLANFTQASDGTITDNDIRLSDPVGTAQRIMKSYAVNGVPQHQKAVLDFLFLQDSWQLTQRLGATGVGQTQEITGDVVASRLL